MRRAGNAGVFHRKLDGKATAESMEYTYRVYSFRRQAHHREPPTGFTPLVVRNCHFKRRRRRAIVRASSRHSIRRGYCLRLSDCRCQQHASQQSREREARSSLHRHRLQCRPCASPVRERVSCHHRPTNESAFQKRETGGGCKGNGRTERYPHHIPARRTTGLISPSSERPRSSRRRQEQHSPLRSFRQEANGSGQERQFGLAFSGRSFAFVSPDRRPRERGEILSCQMQVIRRDYR